MRAYQTAIETRGSGLGKFGSRGPRSAFSVDGTPPCFRPCGPTMPALRASIPHFSERNTMMKLRPVFLALALGAATAAVADEYPGELVTSACDYMGTRKPARIEVNNELYKDWGRSITKKPGQAVYAVGKKTYWGTVQKLDGKSYRLTFDKRKPVLVKQVAPIPEGTEERARFLLITDEETGNKYSCGFNPAP